LSPREHLRFAVAFALKRLPKEWLRRLGKEQARDEVARLAAESIVQQIELSNIRYELGPPSDGTAQIGSRPMPQPAGRTGPA
jgi:hypothetical protein